MTKIIQFNALNDKNLDLNQKEKVFHFLSATECRALYESVCEIDGEVNLFTTFKTGKEFINEFIYPKLKDTIEKYHLSLPNKITLKNEIEKTINNRLKNINFNLFFESSEVLYNKFNFLRRLLQLIEVIDPKIIEHYFKLQNNNVLSIARIFDFYNNDDQFISDMLSPFTKEMTLILLNNGFIDFLKNENFKVSTRGFIYQLTY